MRLTLRVCGRVILCSSDNAVIMSFLLIPLYTLVSLVAMQVGV